MAHYHIILSNALTAYGMWNYAGILKINQKELLKQKIRGTFKGYPKRISLKNNLVDHVWKTELFSSPGSLLRVQVKRIMKSIPVKPEDTITGATYLYKQGANLIEISWYKKE